MEKNTVKLMAKVRKKMLAGETEAIESLIDTEVYQEVFQELKEEIKERVQELFKDVATTYYVDTRRGMAEETNNMIESIRDYEDYRDFYEILDFGDLLEIEEEIMEELEQELGCREDFVIGYNWGSPVMIISMKAFKDEIEEYKDDEYENIGFYINSIEI